MKEKEDTFNFEGYLLEIRKASDGHYIMTVAENLFTTGSGQINGVGKQQHNMHPNCLSYATISMLKKRKFTYNMRQQTVIAVFE